MNYFVRAMWVILIAFAIVSLGSIRSGWRSWKEIIVYDSPTIGKIGLGLLLSLVLLHLIFH